MAVRWSKGSGKARRTKRVVKKRRATSARSSSPLRFAVVGAGHIAQVAVLPAFAHAKRHAVLTAIISDSPRKRRLLANMYDVEATYGYEEFDKACRSGVFDAVYIALPNSMHAEYAERAARAGIHVLCEKPMAADSDEARRMARVCRKNGVRLMIAYRLHYEAANLEAVRIARSGELGELRLFSSNFTMQVKGDNIRTDAALAGGPLMDIGLYCINAARYIFGDEPTEVTAFESRPADRRFKEVPEAVSAIMRFPGERIASITCSFGAAATAWYQVIGTKGDLCVDSAYEYTEEITHTLTVKDRTRERSFKRRDQFAPELIAFAEAVRRGVDPEPGGAEGVIDMLIIEAIRKSVRTGRTVPLRRLPRDEKPRPSQRIDRPPVRKPRLVAAEAAHR